MYFIPVGVTSFAMLQIIVASEFAKFIVASAVKYFSIATCREITIRAYANRIVIIFDD